MARDPYVIVGAGLAGAKAAETLRDEGFDGRVVLLGEEPERPYERPPLSKERLRGEAADAPYVHDAAFYDEHDIELRTGTAVEAIDAGASTVRLADGEVLRFDRLLLATGARPRRLPIPGADLDGVFSLRTLADADALHARLAEGGHVVAIGGGWIGSEVAASARQLGCEVTIVDVVELPLERVLGPEMGAFYRDLHVEHGVAFAGGTTVEAIEGDGRVAAARLADGRRIAADVVVVGVGVVPRVELATAIGLEVGDGVLVDAQLRTDAAGIYAAGDVARAHHPLLGARIRVEHWANALEQGPVAARNMLGRDEPYTRIPYFYSDQYDVGMEYAGYAPAWDEVVVRGDPERRELSAFWLRDGCVLAGMNVNVWDGTEAIQDLVRARRPVDRARLADPDVPLIDLLPAAARNDRP